MCDMKQKCSECSANIVFTWQHHDELSTFAVRPRVYWMAKMPLLPSPWCVRSTEEDRGHIAAATPLLVLRTSREFLSLDISNWH